MQDEKKLAISICKAKESHIEEIIKLWKSLVDFHANLDPVFDPSEDAVTLIRKKIKDEISKENVLYLIAKEEKSNKIIGYCKGGINSYPPIFKIHEHGQVSDIFVSNDFRHLNVGKLLFEEMQKWFIKKEINRIELSVASLNPISPKFWKKMGFHEVRIVLFKNLT